MTVSAACSATQVVAAGLRARSVVYGVVEGQPKIDASRRQVAPLRGRPMPIAGIRTLDRRLQGMIAGSCKCAFDSAP